MNWRNLVSHKIFLWSAAIIVVIGVSVGLSRHYSSSSNANKVDLSPQMFGIGSKKVKKLSSINLVDDEGRQLGPSSFQGKWHLVLLGFTSCPDVCPFTLANLSAVHDKISEHAVPKDIPTVILISVDPHRDKIADLRNYVRHFNPKFRAATGTKEMIDQFVKGIGGFYEFVPKKDDNTYRVNHSAEVFVVDPLGRVVESLNPPLVPHVTATKFQKMISLFHKTNAPHS